MSKYGVFSGPYSVQTRENTDQKNSVFGHFSHSVITVSETFNCLNGQIPEQLDEILHATAFRANLLWEKIPNHIKVSLSLTFFIKKIKFWICKDYPCNISKPYILNLGYMS